MQSNTWPALLEDRVPIFAVASPARKAAAAAAPAAGSLIGWLWVRLGLNMQNGRVNKPAVHLRSRGLSQLLQQLEQQQVKQEEDKQPAENAAHANFTTAAAEHKTAPTAAGRSHGHPAALADDR